MTPDHPLSRAAVVALYTRLLEAWNVRDARAFAAQFAEDGSTVGYDGAPMDGRAAIETELGRIFHVTPAQFHGRPDVAERLTKELDDVLRSGRVVDAG